MPTGYLVGANDVGVIAIELVIRSIAAHHESFCHKSGSYSNMSNSPRDCVSGHRIEQAISYVLEPIARCQQNCQQTALKKSARTQAMLTYKYTHKLKTFAVMSSRAAA